jgi:hypothetical protein
VITTNRPVEAWGKIVGDTAVAAAMLDRLLQRSMVVTSADRLTGYATTLPHQANRRRRITTRTNFRRLTPATCKKFDLFDWRTPMS